MYNPARVPEVAAAVFLEGPPIRYMVTSVVRKQIKTAVQKGEYFKVNQRQVHKNYTEKGKHQAKAAFQPLYPTHQQKGADR